MLQPKTITLPTQDGGERTYIIHKVPAVPMREIVATYPVANMPKLGEYRVSEEIMLKLMAYVGVELEPGKLTMLNMRAMIDNHVPDWEVLARLEWAMLEYNVSFFARAKSSDFLSKWLENNRDKVSSMLTALSGHLSQTGKQPSTS